jgi:hypothetical protein
LVGWSIKPQHGAWIKIDAHINIYGFEVSFRSILHSSEYMCLCWQTTCSSKPFHVVVAVFAFPWPIWSLVWLLIALAICLVLYRFGHKSDDGWETHNQHNGTYVVYTGADYICWILSLCICLSIHVVSVELTVLTLPIQDDWNTHFRKAISNQKWTPHSHNAKTPSDNNLKPESVLKLLLNTSGWSTCWSWLLWKATAFILPLIVTNANNAHTSVELLRFQVCFVPLLGMPPFMESFAICDTWSSYVYICARMERPEGTILLSQDLRSVTI